MSLIKQIINWLTIGLVFLLPIFFLPITAEFYPLNKQTLLLVFTGVMTLLWLAKMFLNQTLVFKRTPLDLPVILFALAYLVISLVAIPNKVIAFSAPTGVGTVLTLTLLYFVMTNNLELKSLRSLLYALIASTTLLGLIAIFQYIGLAEALVSSEKFFWLKDKLFTPAGPPLVLIPLLLAGLSLAITLFLKEFNKKALLISVLTGGASIIMAVGLILTVYQVLPGKERSLTVLSYRDSWAIAIESLKLNPLFGVGPGNYSSAFNRFRPVTFNNNDFWNVRFGNALSYPLELLTIGGLLALVPYLFLLLKTFRLWLTTYRQKKEDSLAFLVGTAFIFLLPWLMGNSLIFLCLTFIFLAVLSSLSDRGELVSLKSKTVALIALVVGLLIILPAFYFWGRVYAADIAYRQSLEALAQNQGVQVYNLQIKTINLNPYSPNYRLVYSQTNFALANAIAAQTDLTDQDRTNITQLIQQAIREAKIATNLNPTDAANWENLAQIYRNLLNFAEGADQWAVAAYRQAIATDPINPRIRVNLGGLFYSLQGYEAATRQFENAVELKPDFANGYYNLAAAYRERKMYSEAYQAMQMVVNLIPADSADYQKAINELDELAKMLPTEASPSAQKEPAKPEEVLTEPQPLPSPVIQPPIELPEESGPEISPIPTTQETTPTP